MYAYWVCAARETPIFSPEFPFRSTSFSQISKKSVPEHHNFHKLPHKKIRSGASPYYNFWRILPFRRPSFSTRSSPPSAGSARTQSVRQRRGLARRVLAVPESPIFTLKTDQAHSGALHFQAQNGSSSFRSPAFSRSTGSSFRSPCQFFTLPRHIPTKIRGDTRQSDPKRIPTTVRRKALVQLKLKTNRKYQLKH